MILDAIFELFVTIITGPLAILFTIIPTPPAWVGDAILGAWDLMEHAYALDHWLPVDLAFTIAAAVLAAYVAAAAIGVVRLVISYLTFGSGAT